MFNRTSLSDRAFGRLSVEAALQLVGQGKATVAQTERIVRLVESVGNMAKVPTSGQIPPELARQLAEQGIDPSSVQMIQLPPTARSGDDLVQTVNGPMKWSDVPKGADGVPTSEWVDANCMCEEHVKKREAKKSKGGPNDGAEEYGEGMSGGYI